MNKKIRMLGVWSAVVFVICFGAGLGLFAHWIPPTPPSLGAQEVADMFRSNTIPIRIGMVLMVIGTTFYLPWTMILSDLIKEIEGKSYFLSGTQLTGGILAMLILFIPSYNWTAAAFRPERNPEITQIFVDQGWLIFITAFPPFVLQNVAIAIAIFIDKRPAPAFPRWVGYVMLWVSAAYLPAVMAFFLKTGPFAWDGLFVWWIPVGMFTLWFAALVPYAYKAVMRQTY